MEEKQQKKAISLKTINILMIAVAVVIVVVLLVLILRVEKRYSELKDNTDIYLECQEVAPSLNRASDYLTDRVRSFAATGNKEYLDQYFEEANITRRRDKAIEVLEPYMKGTPAMEYLETAMDYSLELMNIEYHSMRLEWEAAGLDDKALPEELKSVPLTAEEEALSADEKHEKAISLLFDSNYQSYKTNIRENVDACTAELMSDIQKEQVDSYESLSRILFLLFGMMIIMLLLVLALIFITLLLVMRPMLKAAEYIRDNQTLPVKGASEVQFLAEAYNDAFVKTQRKHDDLQKAALHDALTGLFNRAGYEKIISELEEEKLCLLLIDLDKFKGINDQYGHDVGDLVLKKAADVLRHMFRSDDIIFRFGGDEYAVIMHHTGPDLKDLIRIKIGNANKQLAIDDKLPRSSFSVGAAFGKGTVTEELFKEADNALYKVKKAGGCGVEFSE